MWSEDAPEYTLESALDTIRRVARPPQRVQACACCGGLLPDGAPGEFGTCCPPCTAAGCQPFLGVAFCGGVVDDDLSGIAKQGDTQ